MAELDVRETIDAIRDAGKVIHNLPPKPLFVVRKEEYGRLVMFLTTNEDSEDDNEVAHPPPTILVVSGPKGFGKSTLALQAAYEAKKSHNLRAIIWFNKQRFLDMILISKEDSAGIPSGGSIRSRDEAEVDLDRLLADPENQKLFDLQFDYFRRQGDVSEEERPTRSLLDQLLAAAYPYLLVIDDIDEDFHKRTPQICRELTRVRPPNKVILTSRTSDLPFGNDINVMSLRLGLLSFNQVGHLVRCKCDAHGLARHYWINDNIEETVQWTWINLGGLADVIIHVFRKAQSESKPLDHNTYWAQILRNYALSYIGDGSAAAADEVFDALSADEKYILTTLFASPPAEPNPLSRKDLLKLCVIHEKHPRRHVYNDAITDLYAKRFLGYFWDYDIGMESQTELYQLHPFMRDLIQDKLATYRTNEFLPQRNKLLVQYFEYYSSSEKGQQVLVEHLDQGLAALSLMSERQQWADVINFGRLLVDVLLNDKTRAAADQIDACRQIIAAAVAMNNPTIEIEYRYVLLKLAQATSDDELLKEQLDALLRFASSFDTLDSNVHDWLALAYFYNALKDGEMIKAKQWLRKMNSATELGQSARLEAATYHYQMGNYHEALQEAEAVRGVRQMRSSQNELDLHLYQLLGRIYYKLQQSDDCQSACERAAAIAKGIGHADLADEYLKAAYFMSMLSHPSPLESIGLPDKLSNWVEFMPLGNCPVCRRKVFPLQQATHSVWICPQCKTRFHQDCLSDAKFLLCPTCQGPVPIFGSAPSV